MNMRVLLLLLVSAALNAALLAALVLRPTLAPAAVREFFQRDSQRTALLPARDTASRDTALTVSRERAHDAAAAIAAEKAAIWPALHSTELATLVGRLRAAGFPAWIVRAIVDAEIERQFRPRINELTRTMNETPYWKPDPSYYMGNSKLFEEISQIYRERSRAMRDLLGQDAFAWGGSDPSVAQRMQYGNLSQAKIDLVQRINDDYAEMMAQVRSAMQGVTLPEDREKLALLEREKRADLAAVLSPEELADYEMRTSRITSRLRTAFTIMDASDAEFRAIHRIHEPFSDTLYPTSPTMFTPELSEKRREANTQILDRIKATLGEPRYSQYQRATDSEFQQLYRLGQRDNIPYDTLVRAFDVRATTADASMKIYEDRALSADQKRTALRDLAQNARTQLLSTLGPTAGPAHVESSRWLNYLQQGSAITITSQAIGSGVSFRTIPVAPPTGSPVPRN